MDWKLTNSGIIVPKKHKQYPLGIDLFAGCGGFSLGFIQAGFQIITAVENNTDASHTYMANLGSHPIDIYYASDQDRDRLERYFEKSFKKLFKKGKGIQDSFNLSGSGWIASERRSGNYYPPVQNFHFGDIKKLTGKKILDDVGLEVGDLDVVMGGPPCQGFSKANNKKFNEKIADPRNNMVFEFARLIVEIRPKTFVMENVPDIIKMVTPAGSNVIDEFCRILADGSYMEYEKTMKAFGIVSKDLKRKKVTYGVKSHKPIKKDEIKNKQLKLSL